MPCTSGLINRSDTHIFPTTREHRNKVQLCTRSSPLLPTPSSDHHHRKISVRSYTFFRITSCSWLSWFARLRDLFLESPTVVLLMASSRRSNWQEMARDRTTIGRLSENCCNRVRATIGFGRRPVPVVKHSNLNPKCLLTWVKICAVHLYLAPGTVGQSWDLPDSTRFRHKNMTVVPFTDVQAIDMSTLYKLLYLVQLLQMSPHLSDCSACYTLLWAPALTAEPFSFALSGP